MEWREEQARREEEAQEKMSQEKQDARHAVNVSERATQRAVRRLSDDKEEGRVGGFTWPDIPKPSGVIACFSPTGVKNIE